MPIEQKHQLIDDQAVFKIQQLEGLNKKNIQALKKHYHILSIIGSQSSGKSTLLNALFKTTFEELNRSARVGQTTKGIWYSIDPKSSMMILDIQGSDSHQREERTKFQRRNSLFALAVSHTLLINLWIQQIGLYRGSQLSILQIILQLNLRLFGNEQPKNIIFVIRDVEKNRQNIQGLKSKLFNKVQQVWNNMKKPPGKEHIQLSNLFKLDAYFLPSKIDEPEQFLQQVGHLRDHLLQIAQNQNIITKNVSMADVPQYMKNLWQTITNDKDINLPQQKILLSNMKCQQIKRQCYATYQDQFRDQLEKSQRKMNIQFAANIKSIVKKMLDKYDEEAVNYHSQQAKKVREQFMIQLQRKIQLSYSYQVKHIINECLRQFTDQVNKSFMKDKGIQNIKNLGPQTEQKFNNYVDKVSYKPQWAQSQKKKFSKTLQETFQNQKQRIVVDSLKDFDRSIKKQVQNIVSNAFYEKKIFEGDFWGNLNNAFKQLDFKAKNSIINLYQKLQFKPEANKPTAVNRSINQHVQRARNNASQQLRTVIKMKCNDLLFYMMRHFSVDFNLDAEGIPRQWVNMKPQQITQLYNKTKEKYITLIGNFAQYELNIQGNDQQMKSLKMQKNSRFSGIDGGAIYSKELMTSSQLFNLTRKLQQSMKGQYEQALKKNKQVYVGAIPKWGWILFLIVAIDDIFLWLASPALAIPLTIILVIIGGVLFFGGPSLANSLVTNARRAASNSFGQFTAQAATKIMKGN